MHQTAVVYAQHALLAALDAAELSEAQAHAAQLHMGAEPHAARGPKSAHKKKHDRAPPCAPRPLRPPPPAPRPTTTPLGLVPRCSASTQRPRPPTPAVAARE